MGSILAISRILKTRMVLVPRYPAVAGKIYEEFLQIHNSNSFCLGVYTLLEYALAQCRGTLLYGCDT